METIGTRTTTSGGETMDSSMLLSTRESSVGGEASPVAVLISPSIIDFQSDGQPSSSYSPTATTLITTALPTAVPLTGATTTITEEEEGRTSDENKTEILTTNATATSTGNERWLNVSGGGGGQGDKDSKETTSSTQSCTQRVETEHSQVSGGQENVSLETSTALTTTDNLSRNYVDQSPTHTLLSLPNINLNCNDYDDQGQYKEDSETTTPVPNFCVEGSGGGDSSVTVVTTLHTNGVNLSSCFTESLSNDSTIDGNFEDGCCDVLENGCGSGPISVQSSEDLDMKLSLVSWYSEPEESSRDCCKTNLISRKNITSSTTTSGASLKLGVKSGNVNDKSDEKENKTPMRLKGCGGVGGANGKTANQTQSQRLNVQRMHVQLFEQNCSPAATVENGGNCRVATLSSETGSKKMECPRCARRSKSGTTTPAAPSRTPRRVVQSSKSTQELKKPIKSILKSDSRGSGSGSGSEKQSSMDSLGSASGVACVMTRSEGGSGGRTKFNFNSTTANFSCGNYSSEEKMSKLKRIEKYATLRLKKPRVRPLDFGGSDDAVECHHNNKKNGVGSPDVPSDIMTKSMSFLEKSTLGTGSVASGADGGGYHNHSHCNLKRQGSLRIRKPSAMWEPSSTRTSALRMQKMQEAKNKANGSKYFSGTNHHSGSNHSGSGESIHLQSSHANSSHHSGLHSAGNNTATANNNNSSSAHHTNSCAVSNSNGSNGCHCTNHKFHQQQRQPTNKDKQQHLGAKIFSKLSSAGGQTASSALKRVRQERGIQTDPVSIASVSFPTVDDQSIRISPVPTFEQGTDEAEQIKNMEILAQRYRNTALRFQHEYEKSEEKNRQLIKQLQETQSETTEMIDFLQAEKSTLAESLIEVETEGKKWKEQADSVKKDAQARCSTLVRLSEQHKQEALKAQALLNRLEQLAGKKSAEMSESAVTIQQTRQRIVTLIEKLLKTYKVPHELLASAINTSSHPSGTKLDEAEMNSSLLLPLVSALMNVFPMNSSSSSKESHNNKNPLGQVSTATKANESLVTSVNNVASSMSNVKQSSSPVTTTIILNSAAINLTSPPSLPLPNEVVKDDMSNMINSLQNLNQAILDREAAERLGLDDIDTISRVTAGLLDIQDGDHLSMKIEIDKLNRSLSKLVTVIRVIVIHCDKKVTGVTSNIMQCLRSMEEEKIGAIPEMINMQKSLEAWKNDSGMTHCRDNNSVVVAATGPTSNGRSHNI